MERLYIINVACLCRSGTHVENEMTCEAFLPRTKNAKNLLWGKHAVANVCVGASTSIWKENDGQFAQMNSGRKKNNVINICQKENGQMNCNQSALKK